MKFHYIVLLLFVSTSCKKQPVTQAQNHIKTEAESTASTIQFSGYTWNVTNAISRKQGPGPNYFNSSNAFVDANGLLHLKLTKNTSNGKWYCAEVATQQSFGYGTYQWWVEGPIDKLNKNVVLGFFNYSGFDGYDEMDIEYARWGNSANNNLDYTIYPDRDEAGFSPTETTKNIILNGTYTTQRFKRTASSVYEQSLHGFTNTNTNQYASFTVNKPPNSVSKYSMPILINLWLFNGAAPSDGKDIEIIIHKFTYTP